MKGCQFTQTGTSFCWFVRKYSPTLTVGIVTTSLDAAFVLHASPNSTVTATKARPHNSSIRFAPIHPSTGVNQSTKLSYPFFHLFHHHHHHPLLLLITVIIIISTAMGNASTKERSLTPPHGSHHQSSTNLSSSSRRGGPSGSGRLSSTLLGGAGDNGGGAGGGYSGRGRSRHGDGLFGLSGRETRERDREAEREARELRKAEREKERLKERERSLREESVDGG